MTDPRRPLHEQLGEQFGGPPTEVLGDGASSFPINPITGLPEEPKIPTTVIQSVAVEPDRGLQISYYHPRDDLKCTGVMHMHTLCIPPGSHHDRQISVVLDALVDLVELVLDELPTTPPLGL